jgi:hypothetical protein
VSAPSVEHETRVSDLIALATLAGYQRDVDLMTRQRPDVVRIHDHRPALFVGDAKARETAGCRSTRHRLVSYAEVIRLWTAAGYSCRLAIAHREDPLEAWLRLLTEVVGAAGLVQRSMSVAILADDLWLSSVDLSVDVAPRSASAAAP